MTGSTSSELPASVVVAVDAEMIAELRAALAGHEVAAVADPPHLDQARDPLAGDPPTAR